MLNPYDGANKVRLPNGTECWEKETVTHGMESVPSYQYSEDTGLLELDYHGRVVDLEVWNKETGQWCLVVNYYPITSSAVERMRKEIQGGWAEKSRLVFDGVINEGSVADRMLDAKGYLEIYDKVMVILQGEQ